MQTRLHGGTNAWLTDELRFAVAAAAGVVGRLLVAHLVCWNGLMGVGLGGKNDESTGDWWFVSAKLFRRQDVLRESARE
jgi:hypothetical protein